MKKSRRTFTYAKIYAWLCLFLLLWLPSTGCSRHPADVWEGEGEGRHTVSDPETRPSVVTSGDADVQREFERAVEAYHDNHADIALSRFRDFVDRYPDDALASRARIWLARSYMMADQADSAVRMLDEFALQGTSQEQGDIALAWSAFILHANHAPDQARQRLETLMAQREDFHVLEGMGPPDDIPLIAAMMADHRIRRRAFTQALRDLEIVERTSHDEPMRAWAIAAGMTIASQAMDAAQLHGLVYAPSTYQKAMAVGAYVAAQIDAQRMDLAEQGFQEAAPALLQFGLEKEFASLQNTLTLSGQLSRPMFGIAVSLSGADRFAGDSVLRGVLLAQRSFEPRTRSVDAWIEDTRGSREGAEEAVQRLCEKKVPIILGPLEQALVPIVKRGAEACGALYVGLDTIGQEAGQALRVSLDARDEARTLMDYLDRQQASSVVFVTESTKAAYFQAMIDEATTQAARRHITVLNTLEIDTSALQKSSEHVAKTIRQLQPRALFFAVSDTTMTAVSSYLAAQNIWPRADGANRGPDYVASSFAWSATLALNSADYIEQMVVASWTDPAAPRYLAFAGAYTQAFGGRPGVMSAFAFDATSISRALLLEHGLHRGDQMRAWLRKGFRYDGVTGVWRWQDQRQEHAPLLLRIHQGEASPL